jgi:hypothetical protein
MARVDRKNPDAKNFGLCSKNLFHAGRLALHEGLASHASRATMTDRWRQFCVYAKEEFCLSDLRRIKVSHLEYYAAHLHDRLDRGEIGAATAQNLLSAVNRVMEIARGDRRVHLDPVRGAGLPNRSGIATEQRAMQQAEHDRLRERVPDRLAAQLDLQRTLGLRFEESSKLDARALHQQAQERGEICIQDGTKGGRPRNIPITGEHQMAALARAAELQGQHRSLIPAELSYAQYRAACYRHGIAFHRERHAYAQARYAVMTGAACPVEAAVPHRVHHRYLAEQLGLSVPAARELDRAVRLQIAEELGHGRIDVTNSYLG